MPELRFDDLGPGEVRVASAHDLQKLTSEGWQLVFSYQETSNMLCSETEPCSANGYAGTVGVTRFRPFITTFFVLRKNETSRLAELNVSLTEAKNETDKAKVAHSEAEKQVERLKRDVDAAKRAETIASKQVTEVATERDRFRTAANKLETDMAKIRKAIGEIRCQEILG